MMEPHTHPNPKRFRVGLSFAGEHRSFVEGVAEQLSRNLGRNRVFYDRYHEAELARPNLDTYLIKTYREDTDLIAIFLSANYTQKEWCGLEWSALRDILKRKSGAEIMTFKFDEVMIEGLLSIDGYINVGSRTPEEVALLILKRIDDRETVQPISFYFDLNEFTPEDITEIIALLSELYREEGGDKLVIDDITLLDPSQALQEV